MIKNSGRTCQPNPAFRGIFTPNFGFWQENTDQTWEHSLEHYDCLSQKKLRNWSSLVWCAISANTYILQNGRQKWNEVSAVVLAQSLTGWLHTHGRALWLHLREFLGIHLYILLKDCLCCHSEGHHVMISRTALEEFECGVKCGLLNFLVASWPPLQLNLLVLRSSLFLIRAMTYEA